MILATWLKGSLRVLEKRNISEDYNRYQDEGYQQKVVSSELQKMSYDWECMEYGLFETEDDLQSHLKYLNDEKIKALKEVQHRLKGISSLE